MKFRSAAVCAAALLVAATAAYAGKKKDVKDAPEGYVFTVEKTVPVTSTKNQANSGTCWAFSGVSFFESEILRNGYSEPLDLSEMFVVHHAYCDRAEKYVRLQGALRFGPGSSFGNVLQVLKTWGMVPDSEMPGLEYGSDRHAHRELDALARAYVEVIVKNPNKKLSTAWKKGFEGIMDAYLGDVPEKFTVSGVEYTPKTYMESLGINLDDYVDITSWTHHPFYEKMIIEVPDNWIWGEAYNVPLDDVISIIDNALANGYSVAWATDASERGFTRDGIGLVPDWDALEAEQKSEAGSDQEHWIGKDESKKALDKRPFEAPCPEIEITQEMRQEAFDNYSTTDDHGMHIYGVAKDQNGKKYYVVKNSWGDAGKYHGVWYVSEAYVRYKTTDLLVNRNAIPSDIRTKLGL